MSELCADRREMERFVTQVITGLEQLEGAVKQLVYCEAFQGVVASHIKPYYSNCVVEVGNDVKVTNEEMQMMVDAITVVENGT